MSGVSIPGSAARGSSLPEGAHAYCAGGPLASASEVTVDRRLGCSETSPRKVGRDLQLDTF